jgi:hypothetical protein
VSVTLERMESTSSAGARTLGPAAREHRAEGTRRRRGRWRAVSGGVEEEIRTQEGGAEAAISFCRVVWRRRYLN